MRMKAQFNAFSPSAKEMNGQHLAPADLTQSKEPLVLVKVLNRPWNRCGRGGRKKTSASEENRTRSSNP
jgi:hypothetical protein